MSRSDLEELRQSIAQVLSRECGSRALHAFIDRKTAINGKTPLDQAIAAQARDLGWLALGLAEGEGGLGFGLAGLDVLHRELGRHLVPGGLLATLSAAQWLSSVADAAQKSRYLRPVMAGERDMAVPATLLETAPLPCAGGKLTGTLPAMLGTAGAAALVPVKDTKDGPGFALLEPRAEAFSPLTIWDRSRTLHALRFEDTPLRDFFPDPDGALAARLTRILALAAAADALGAAQGAADQTIAYMKTRVQFDRPIGSFQALKHRAANIATQLATNGHLLVQALAAAQDDGPDADLWAALAKASITDAASFITADCIQLHGGVGFTWEFDLHLYLKRARLDEMLVGTNRGLRDLAAARMTIAARENRSVAEIVG